MASQLTAVSLAVRQFGPAVLIGLVSVIVIWNLGKYGIENCCVSKATPTPILAPKFGVLEPLAFAEKPTLSAGVKINLETIDGTIAPTATVSAYAYEITQKSPGLDYSKKSLTAAQKAGFIDPIQEEISTTSFLFTNPSDQNNRMTYNFAYGNLLYEYQNMNSYISLEQGSSPNTQTAIAQARKFITDVRPDIEIPDSAAFDKTYTINTTFYYLESGTDQLRKVDTQPQANLTVLNIVRPPIQGAPIVGPYTTESLINFVYTGITASQGPKTAQTRLLKAKLTYWPITLNNTPGAAAIYPIKPTSVAWDQLLQGKGYILNKVEPGDEFNMRKVYLGYFEPDVQAKTLQPVWVFEGDKPNDSTFLFRAIVPAVADGYHAPVQ